MIKTAEQMNKIIQVKMRDGDGQATITKVIESEEMNGKCRLVATITLAPECSIGEHVHENEEEIFYIIKGVATYNDNGEQVTLNAGDSCICLGGQKHSIANRQAEGDLVIFATILTY